MLAAGRVVEQGPVDDVLGHPRDPYTVRLMNDLPRLASTSGREATPALPEHANSRLHSATDRPSDSRVKPCSSMNLHADYATQKARSSSPMARSSYRGEWRGARQGIRRYRDDGGRNRGSPTGVRYRAGRCPVSLQLVAERHFANAPGSRSLMVRDPITRVVGSSGSPSRPGVSTSYTASATGSASAVLTTSYSMRTAGLYLPISARRTHGRAIAERCTMRSPMGHIFTPSSTLWRRLTASDCLLEATGSTWPKLFLVASGVLTFRHRVRSDFGMTDSRAATLWRVYWPAML